MILSRRLVNALYLFVVLLVVTLGVALQVWSAVWGLIYTEWVLIFLPTIFVLRRNRLSLRETLRLHWPGMEILGLSLVVGVGLGFFALWFSQVLALLMGYTFYAQPGLIPRNWGDALLVYFAMVVSAPVCEEALFRGAIQQAYEPYGGAKRAVIVVGLLFAMFHLSPQRFLAVLPVALALGYLAWRSNSILASIGTHFAYNFVATSALVIASLRPETRLEWMGGPIAAGAGLIAAAVALWLVQRRIAPRQAEPDAAPILVAEQDGWLKRNWTLLAAALVFGLLGVLEITQGRAPENFVREKLALQQPEWKQATEWKYDLRNVLDESVGDATCTLFPYATEYVLSCQIHQQAFETQQEKSYFKTDAYERQLRVAWNKADLRIVTLDSTLKAQNYQQVLQISKQGTGLFLAIENPPDISERLEIPADALVIDEWPWRLMALEFQQGGAWKTTLVWPLTWSEQAGRSLPQAKDAAVVIRGVETITVPAGEFNAWRVELGRQVAWYTIEPPHVLLRYDADMVHFLLK